MLKILLIKPRFFDGFWLHESITQPIGLMYIGATLKRSGYHVKIHDCCRDHKDLHILKRILSVWKPDYIGISIIITEVKETLRIMGMIREIKPDIPVVFGGPWPSANPEQAILKLGADFVVLGEGELIFPQLINSLRNGLIIGSIPGIASIVNGSVKVNPKVYLTEEELNNQPFPAWDLLDNTLYSKMNSMPGVGRRPYMPIITSRGCPYRCVYCHQTMGKVFRKRSAESVIAEIETLRFQFGFKEFEILDDCFNLDRKRMQEILKGIRDKIGDVRLHFPNAVRSDLLDPEDIPLFKDAGTVSLFFAIETASPRLQKMINKNLNLEKASYAIEASVRAGIYSTGYFMIGFPSETYEEALHTVKFAARSLLHRALFFNPIPFAGTELEKMAADVLKNRQDMLDPRVMNYHISTLNISAMSDRSLQKISKEAYRRFYLNPRRIFRLIKFISLHPDLFTMKRLGAMFINTFLSRERLRK
jgi:radical SAM superfamily enzyme YgiQ (UPF0313 family)